jgi:hypothetical protein
MGSGVRDAIHVFFREQAREGACFEIRYRGFEDALTLAANVTEKGAG